MKKILLSISLLALTIAGVCSCSSHADEGAEAADSFFFAYTAAEYDKAMTYCNDEVREAVEETAAVVDSLDENLREAYLELSRGLSPERVSVYEHSSDSLTVEYHTLIPDEIEPICNAVTIIYSEAEQGWKVVDVR